jgi:predicted transcriptional regulator/chitodextrinase
VTEGVGAKGAVRLLFLMLAITPAVLMTAAADGNQAPVAIITLPGDNGLFAPGEPVQLDGRRSFDPDGTIANWSWDLGDGNFSDGAQGSHAYGLAGNCTVTLTVTSADGGNASASVEIFVKNPMVEPIKIDAEEAKGGKIGEGEKIAFGPVSLSVAPGYNDTRTFIWDFGDGKTFTGRNPEHSYDRPGNYTVKLTTLDGDNGSVSTFQITVRPVASSPNNWPWALLAVSMLLVVGFAAFLGGTEMGLLLLSPIFIFLYSRIRQDQILDNYTRGQIHGYIIANPGEHYSSIKSALDLNNGTLAYHLQRLENENVIKSAMDGTHRRYYPASMKVPEPDGGALTEVQKLIVAKVAETPGISQRDIGSLMKLSPATVNYHIDRLVAKGVIRRVRAGMRYRIFVNEAVLGNPPKNDN